ncbi:hypothetical protein DFJ58DRAFT_840303 [Suillus subalutaceus]|uniref:uncharacterized protein n=1 Tax=Suillus subalutaceus TaxID=48586 RepID=UPI001B87BC93|nr:uncharacterized protein DFJ58DRAFT_840303 [Suillus subalutaceus]KAG1859024.1 hypothetical protein DFJ58DRAFT_840303 [Suillus subalutaceus]
MYEGESQVCSQLYNIHIHSKANPAVTLSRQRVATKHWLEKPGVRDMQNAKARVRMASSPVLDGLNSRDITPEVNDGSLLTMENDFPCSCDTPTLQDIENMANQWQKGWARKSEHAWDDVYENLLKGQILRS